VSKPAIFNFGILFIAFIVIGEVRTIYCVCFDVCYLLYMHVCICWYVLICEGWWYCTRGSCSDGMHRDSEEATEGTCEHQPPEQGDEHTISQWI